MWSRNQNNTMKTFRNANFTSRNYECTNVVCCQTDNLAQAQAMMPGANWIECSEDEIIKGRMTQLWRQGDVCFFGWM